MNVHLEINQIISKTFGIQQNFLVGGKKVGNDKKETSIHHIKFKSPADVIYIDYRFADASRSGSDYGETKLMPGFRLRWWYSGAEAVPEGKYLKDIKTTNLRR